MDRFFIGDEETRKIVLPLISRSRKGACKSFNNLVAKNANPNLVLVDTESSTYDPNSWWK